VRIFISAGEASGDLYASRVVETLRTRHPDATFFGCAGPRMQAAGVRTIVDSRSIAVAGLVEVVAHIPRILRLFRQLVRAAANEKPDLAILTDAPDFHLRLAKKLKKLGIPVVYLIAPQAWAWRSGRVRIMRRRIDRLLCIFPFEQQFFESRGVPTTYLGHPLARIVRPSMTREAFLAEIEAPANRRIVVLLPGSRQGEVHRHMPALFDAVRRIRARQDVHFILALPPGFNTDEAKFRERARAESIQVKVGLTWDALAYADLALAASGTVTIEAALLGAPLVSFYRVNALSWILGRWLVKAPFLSMVNLVAGRQIAPELIQGEMTGERIAAEAIRLLDDDAARAQMRADLAQVAALLASRDDPMETAASWIEKVLSESKNMVHAG
jgi:lipid-A-disaccharide synthase